MPLAVGAFAAGMICALATGFLKENSRIKEDTVMGVVFSGMFGLGIVLYVKIQTDVHLDHILFGDMLGVGWRDIVESGVIAAVAAGVIVVKWRDLLLHAFDPAQARPSACRCGCCTTACCALLSLTIVGALKAVGIILAIALLIAPGRHRLPADAPVQRHAGRVGHRRGAGIASSASISSFFIDSAPAPTIVLLMTIAFIAAFVFVTSRAARLQRHEAALAVEPNDP